MKLHDIQDGRLQELVDELCQKIQEHYPEAVFRIYPPDGDPKSITVDAYTSEEDSFKVLDLVARRAMDILVDEDYYIGIVPLPLSAWKGPAGG